MLIDVLDDLIDLLGSNLMCYVFSMAISRVSKLRGLGKL